MKAEKCERGQLAALETIKIRKRWLLLWDYYLAFFRYENPSARIRWVGGKLHMTSCRLPSLIASAVFAPYGYPPSTRAPGSVIVRRTAVNKLLFDSISFILFGSISLVDNDIGKSRRKSNPAWRIL